MSINRFVFDVEMVDGTVHRNVTAIVADQMAYSSTRRKHKWDGPQEDPLLFANFLAFSALRRNGLFDGGFDAFCNAAAAVAEIGDDDEAEVARIVDPTSPALSSD
ncbi:hypothetical protein [Rhodococcus tibetensis]|uniref:Uncharacterized protein n=1 Tax=Rhodococcus tibetensis TaxID=2965064 RepID=A0ABT1QDP6_9NOCA|nr:hypothetical protein [Rhodococcus sp. FXJ9.536]MCQ4120404.1 hypothetical protein [Rhodococcus sp. FXJ9.536]